MRRDSLGLFKLIQLRGSVTVLDIQITVIVIVNEIQMVADALAARWISIKHPVYRCMISNNIGPEMCWKLVDDISGGKFVD